MSGQRNLPTLCSSKNTDMNSTTGYTFKYFAYGSNLLKERIQIKNPSARFCCTGKLSGYRFTFDSPTSAAPFTESRWHGSGATIVPTSIDNFVHGAVWELDTKDLSSLDRQESGYHPTEVQVELESGSTETCRTYIMSGDKTGIQTPGPYYKKVIVDGARQCGLDPDYVQFIESFPDSGIQDVPEVYLQVLELMQKSKGHDKK